uniref:LSDAT_euk domain-containing protein n=1 Tax=Macrostomum lignano TaxID=282301 RepID=A0A1I8IYQ2_9PLAT
PRRAAGGLQAQLPPAAAHTCNLDVNHTHFLLVDNGTQLRFGTEIPARARIEHALADSAKDTGQVPTVCLVVQGGPGTVQTVKCAVEQGTPVLLVRGSQGAADILAYAYAHSLPSKAVVEDSDGNEVVRVERQLTEDQVRQLTSRLRGEFGDKRVPELMDWIETILKYDHLVSVYELESDDFSCNLDVAILQAIMKANHKKEDQLKLALTLNRDDIARKIVFDGEFEWSTHSLEPFMYKALVLDRPKFVKIFLDNNFMMKEFLSIEKLVFLYNTIYPDNRAKEYIWKVFMKMRDKGKRYFSLEDVGEVLESVAGQFFQSPYLSDPRYIGLCPDVIIRPDEPGPVGDQDTKEKLPILKNARLPIYVQSEEDEQEATLPHFDDPYNDLFCAHQPPVHGPPALEEVSEPLTAALFAHRVWSEIADNIEDDMREQQEIRDAAREFEQLAIQLSNETSKSDPIRSELLLIRVSEFFGSSTPLQLASYSHSLDFVSQDAPQRLLNDPERTLKLFVYVVLTIACFPLYLIGALLGTLRDPAAAPRPAAADGRRPGHRGAVPAAGRGWRDLSRRWRKLETGLAKENIRFLSGSSTLSCCRKLLEFHQSPRVIFMYNYLFYLMFLLLYTYVILTEFNPIMLMIWIGTLIVEEIRQALFVNRHTFREKLIEYATDPWNIMDMVILVLFLLGIVCRVQPTEDGFAAGRVFYAIDLVLFFFRLLHFYSLDSALGPYLVMIGRMIRDLFHFWVVFLVLVTGYGIAQQAILFPNSFKEAGLIKDVYQRAFYQIFGEFQLDIMQGELPCTFDEDEWANNTMPRCATPEGTWISPILLAAYIILANVLMLNLLIATFAHTFNTLKGHTNDTWRFMRISLVREYSEKPCLPPPLIIFSHAYQLIRLLCKHCWRCSNHRCGCGYNTRSPLQHRFSESVERQLKNWECLHILEITRRMKKANSDADKNILRKCNDQLSNLSKKVDQLPAAASAGSSRPRCRRRRCRHPSSSSRTWLWPKCHRKLLTESPDWESQFESVTSTLSSLMTAVQSLKAATRAPEVHPAHEGAAHSRPREADADGDSMEPSFSHGAAGKGGTPSQTLSLTSPYPGAGGPARLPLRPDQLAWAAELPGGYKPPEFSAPEPDADGEVDRDDPAGLAFNTFDEASGSERRSFAAAPYSLDAATGRPLNPAGRTGLAGRGRLPAWGPNHARPAARHPLERRGKRALELLALPADSGEGGYRAPELPARRLPIDGDCRRLLADAQQRQGGQAPLTVPEAAAARLSEVTAAARPRFRWRLPGRRAEHRQRLAGAARLLPARRHRRAVGRRPAEVLLAFDDNLYDARVSR